VTGVQTCALPISLAEPGLTGFEEHLLVCESCQDRLACEDSIRQRVRDGAAVLQQTRAPGWRRLPRLAWASGVPTAGLVIFAGSGFRALRRSTAAPAVILRQALRGTEYPTVDAAP